MSYLKNILMTSIFCVCSFLNAQNVVKEKVNIDPLLPSTTQTYYYNQPGYSNWESSSGSSYNNWDHHGDHWRHHPNDHHKNHHKDHKHHHHHHHQGHHGHHGGHHK